jgi:hypothetical protein
MMLACLSLPISPSWSSEEGERIYLVRSNDALRLCKNGEFESVAVSQAVWEFDRTSRSTIWQVRGFVAQARLFGMDVTSLGNGQMVHLVREKIRHGELVGVKQGEGWDSAGQASNATVEQRRLVRQIEGATRGRLNEAGRQYRLIAGADLTSLPDRDSYHVVRREDAQQVLETLSKQAVGGDAKTLLLKAQDKLSPDWRPPLLPNGLVLLRKVEAPRVAATTQEQTFTPSQLWGRKDKDDIIDWIIWIELDPSDPKAQDDVVILLDEFYQEVMRKPLASCPREGTGVLVTFEKINKQSRFTLIRDYGPDEGGGQDTLFIDSTPAEMDERGSQAS